MRTLWSVVLVAMLAVVHMDADAARRMGGGRSFGKQSNNVTQREAVRPATPAAPGQNAAGNAATAPKPAAANAGAAAAGKKPWGAMLGGLAAGLGLAWLASSLGLGAEFGQFLLIALLALAAFAVFSRLKRAGKPAGAGPLAYQGAAGAAPDQAPMARQYKPEKVGNDASARPWEQFAGNGAAGGGASLIGSALAGSQNWGIPQGFDTAGFLEAAKRNFTTLQDAWDRADMTMLRSMMTDDMLEEIRQQLSEREAQSGGAPNVTHIEGLEAQLLGIEDLGDSYMASVEFSGMSREELGAGLNPFREVWNMTKSKSGASGWLVAGLQALQ